MDMIIGVAGKKNHGKDTICDILVDQHGFDKLSFAAKGKQVICETFGISLEELDYLKNDDEAEVILQGVFDPITDELHPSVQMTVREFLQRFFNEEGMKSVYGPAFHVDQLIHPNFQHAGFKYCINDLRYPLEAMRIKELGGYVVEVIRPDVESDDEHSSEQQLPNDLIDFFVENDGTVEELANEINEILEEVVIREERKYEEATGDKL